MRQAAHDGGRLPPVTAGKVLLSTVHVGNNLADNLASLCYNTFGAPICHTNRMRLSYADAGRLSLVAGKGRPV